MTAYHSLDLRGETSLSGTRHVRFSVDGQPTVRLPFTECFPAAALIDKLARRGMQLSGKPALDRVTQELAGLTTFPKARIVDHPGWNGRYFALPCGRVIAPPGAKKMTGAFSIRRDPLQVTGTLEDWQDEVATPLTGQILPMFAVMLAFAAPLLDLLGWKSTPIFELVAPLGSGKSLVQLLAASVVGCVSQEPISFSDLIADTDGQLPQHAGGLMLIGDPQLALAGLAPATVALKVRDAVTGLSAGPRLASGRRSASPAQRSVCLITSRESLREQIDEKSPVSKVVAHELITLRVVEKRLLGILNIVPAGFDGLDRLEASLRAAAERYHGSPLRHYLKCLVEERAANEGALRSRLKLHVDLFLRKCGIDRSDAAAMRVAKAFALAYAAARLAKHYQVLPQAWKTCLAVLDCYRKHGAAPATPNPYLARLEEIAAGPNVVTLCKGVEFDPAAVEASKVFVRYRGGFRHLMIDRQFAGELFGIDKDKTPPPALAKLMTKEKGHFAPWRRLPGGVRKRLYSFRLPKEPPQVSNKPRGESKMVK